MGDSASMMNNLWATGVLPQYLGLAVGAVLLVGLVLVMARMKKIRRECRETIAQRYNSKDIICHDNLVHYLGSDSSGSKKSRGKGVLLLVNNELYFYRLHPKKELIIPIKRIKRVVTPTTFMEVVSSVPLLQLMYKEEDGRLASVAWKVRDVQCFTRALQEQRKKLQPRKKK